MPEATPLLDAALADLDQLLAVVERWAGITPPEAVAVSVDPAAAGGHQDGWGEPPALAEPAGPVAAEPEPPVRPAPDLDIPATDPSPAPVPSWRGRLPAPRHPAAAGDARRRQSSAAPFAIDLPTTLRRAGAGTHPRWRPPSVPAPPSGPREAVPTAGSNDVNVLDGGVGAADRPAGGVDEGDPAARTRRHAASELVRGARPERSVPSLLDPPPMVLRTAWPEDGGDGGGRRSGAPNDAVSPPPRPVHTGTPRHWAADGPADPVDDLGERMADVLEAALLEAGIDLT